jgi:NAD(P)-dependent dehydrogenase (short-subunit alcohol dehydrogenase family)
VPSPATPVIWVTGASSGLGRSLALQLARGGALVIASARDLEALSALQSSHPNIRALDCDITDNDSLQNLAARMGEISPRLDQAILNAGTCEYLDFPSPDWEAIRRVMEVNFFGTVNCIRLALPMLRQSTRAQRQLVVIASQVTAAPFPRAEAYGASKAALQYFSDSLRMDLAAEKIGVKVINPGFVDTPLTRKNDFEMPFLMSADEAASRIVGKLQTTSDHYSFPRRLSLLLSLSKWMPRLWQKAVGPAKASSATHNERDNHQ